MRDYPITEEGVTVAAIDDVLASTNIDGLDIPDALSRLNNLSKVYVRIIHSFTQNMPKMLDDLATVTEATLPDYTILVHGTKGSCYGIGANKCGDMAQELEHAGKAGDWAYVQQNNAAYIEAVKVLIAELIILEERLESLQAPTGAAAASPDKAKLAKLLEATKNYDVETMFNIIEDLEKQKYTSGGEIVPWLRQQFDNFAYDAIVEKLSSM